jgi:hypothetical protein
VYYFWILLNETQEQMKTLIDQYHRLYLVEPVLSVDTCENVAISSLDILMQDSEEGSELELIYSIRDNHLDDVMNMRAGTTILIHDDRTPSLNSVVKITRYE